MTEFRFDDLDLREEAASPAREQDTTYSNAPAAHGNLPIFTTTHACCV